MAKKRIVMAIGHKDMGTNLPEQKEAVQRTAKVIADFIPGGLAGRYRAQQRPAGRHDPHCDERVRTPA